MHSTSSTDKLYSQLTALTSDKKYFVQISNWHRSNLKSSKKHLMPAVCTHAARLRQPKTFASVSLYTCNPLTSGKNICFSQFVHLQPAYVVQKNLLVSLYTCSPLTSGKSICFSQFVHLQPAYVEQKRFVQARPLSPWKKGTAGKLNINLSLQC